METRQQNNAPITVGGWFGIMILSGIPLLNLIMAIIWASSPGTRVSLRNYGKAMLIWIAIIVVLVILLAVLGVFSASAIAGLVY